jgi:peptidoglycan/LPS O-acetylase OafA/YrhL
MRLQRVLGTLWMAVCGGFSIRCLWMLLYHASYYLNAFYYSVAWFFCWLYLIGAVAGIFLLRRARWARKLAGCVSVLIVLATITAKIAWGSLPVDYYVVSILATAALVLLLLPTHDQVAP